MLALRIVGANSILAVQVPVIAPAYLTPQRIARTDVELAPAIGDIDEDDVLKGAGLIIVYDFPDNWVFSSVEGGL
jgi:hypothetical protein